jgi:cysteine-rich repeat protein
MHSTRGWLRPLIVLSVLAVPVAGGAWPTLIPDTPGDSRPFALVADAAGDVVAAGRQLSTTGDDDALVAKLAGADGSIVWQRTVDGAAPPENEAGAEVYRAVALAAGGDVVAAGRVVGLTTGNDALVARHAALDGTPLWQVTLDGGAGAGDDAQGVAVDASGDVFVAGAMTALGSLTAQPALVKLGGEDGSERWRTLLSGEMGTGRAVVVDGTGDVLVGGDVGPDLFVAKHAGGDGTEMWRVDVPGELGEAVARGLALLPGGGAVVVGRLVSAATARDFVVVAVGADGAERWRYVLDGAAVDPDDADEAFGVAVDGAGDVVVAGMISNVATRDDGIVVKLDGATGTEKWRLVIDGENSRNDDLNAVAVDAAGDVVAVGGLRNGGSGRDLAVLSIDGATGAERWRRSVDGGANGNDVGFAAAVDGAGNALAAGRTRDGEAGDGFMVLKLTAATGGDFPCGTGTLEAPEACDDGNRVLGDGCRPDCTVEACGDGILDPQEACDDGNLEEGDCCSAACTLDANGTPCDDGDRCTDDDACTAGGCRGVPKACVPVDDCHDASCDGTTGSCVDAPKPDGRLCDDGDACTVVDECTSGTCQPGLERPCDDFEPCTVDGCDASSGCVHEALTGFDSVTCAFDPYRVGTFCFEGLPHGIEHRMARALQKVARAAEATKVRRARRLLKRAGNLADKTRRKADKQTARGTLTPACGATLDVVLTDVAARARALRDTLGTSAP